MIIHFKRILNGLPKHKKNMLLSHWIGIFFQMTQFINNKKRRHMDSYDVVVSLREHFCLMCPGRDDVVYSFKHTMKSLIDKRVLIQVGPN